MGLSAAQICLQQAGNVQPDAIVTGTGLACVTDLALFLRSVIQNEGEGISPIPFINSSHNMVTAQIARMLKINGYNNTHCNRRLSFEHALLDGMMLLNEGAANHVLVGGIDEYSDDYHRLAEVDYEAGEGAGFFLLHRHYQEGDVAKIVEVKTWHGQMGDIKMDDVDVAFLGLNGEEQEDRFYYPIIEKAISHHIPIIKYKQQCGEYMTSSAYALAMAATSTTKRRALIYNQYWGMDHALTVLETIE